MPALDQQVGRRHDPAVGRAHHRGVVAHAEQRRPIRRQQLADGRDQAELA